MSLTEEEKRLLQLKKDGHSTAKWGPYLSERQWGTVREDYSADGSAWDYFPHDHARSRVYRWGEDGIAGIADDECQLCFSFAFWNGKDPILKERLYGLTNSEGNHGEDVKELYYYQDNTPTHSYMQYLYKYPQAEYPYAGLLDENRRRTEKEEEFELIDTGLFNEGRYFDITITYAKNDEEDICILIEAKNIGPEKSKLTLLPTLWFRNQWDFDLIDGKADISSTSNKSCVKAHHSAIGDFFFHFEQTEKLLFTENATNTQRLFNVPNASPFVKDAFHDAVIKNDFSIFDQKTSGTKFSPVYETDIEAGATSILKFRICRNEILKKPLNFDKVITDRKTEADDFYAAVIPQNLSADHRNIARKAYAGMLWNKQFYYYDILDWTQGDKGFPPPPAERLKGRNTDWLHLNNRDIISMPDKWEYPWYASWDLAFHTVTLANIDPQFAKSQQILITREWYTHPNGQIPAYEWNFSDVNPPVQAWAAMRIYEIDKKKTGKGDIRFLKRIFQKLTINFTWWANRKDIHGSYIYEGGFLGLDNIGIFDRSKIQDGYKLEQADGTAWMGMFASNMLQIALEIAQVDDTFEDVATKYFEHYIFISEACNEKGLWDENDFFFYDVLQLPDGSSFPLKVRSLVGMTPLFAAFVLTDSMLDKLKSFKKGIQWFRKYRKHHGEYLGMVQLREDETGDKLITMIYREKLEKILESLLDENEFLSPYGIRSISKKHSEAYNINIGNQNFSLVYTPGESDTKVFGGNSNWRGPIWFPMNYLIIRSIIAYYGYFKDDLKVQFPSNSGNYINLKEVAVQLSLRLSYIFTQSENGDRVVNGRHQPFYCREENKDLFLFHEYFHGDTGMGLGASHQTGWTGLISTLIQEIGE